HHWRAGLAWADGACRRDEPLSVSGLPPGPQHHRPGRQRGSRRGHGLMGVLEGSHAVVTGGASGIGRAIATAFAAEGADVTIFDRADEDRLAVAATAVAQGGGKVHARRVNVAYEEEIVTAFDALAGQGGIDILVSSAG